MKRVKLIRHLNEQGCVFVREGGSHTVYYNPQTRLSSTIPRHSEIHENLAKKICKDLGIPVISS